MNVFHKIALQGLRKNPAQTIVTIVGVMLSAAMITAVCTFGVSLLHYLAEGAALKYGGWHAAFLDVPASFAQTRSHDSKVAASAMIDDLGAAQLSDSRNADKPYFFLVGYDREAMETMPLTLLSGRLPEHGGEVLVSGSAVSDGGAQVKVGDTLTLNLGSRMKDGEVLDFHAPYDAEAEYFQPEAEHSYTVVGICQTPSYLRDAYPGYPLITTSDYANPSGKCSVFLTLKQPYTLYSYIDEVSEGQHVTLNDNVLRFMGLSADKLFTTLLFVVGGVVLAVIMIGSVFLIHNSFHISLNERTHQLGILMSVGATSKQLRSSVLFEGFYIGWIGIPLGMLAGLGCMQGVLKLVAKNFQNIMYDGVDLTLVLSPPVLILAALVSLITILVSAYIPARKAAAVLVMDCIRQTGEIKTEGNAVRVSRLSYLLFGLEGTLALKNFKRNKKRYRSIILSLVLSVVLFITTNAFVLFLTQASEMAYVATTFDICLSVPRETETQQLLSLLDQTKTAEGVTGASYEEVISCRCTMDPQSLSSSYWAGEGTEVSAVTLQMNLIFMDDASFQQLLQKEGLSGYTQEGDKILTCAKIQDHSERVLDPDEFVDLFAVPEQIMSIAAPVGEGVWSEGRSFTFSFVNFVPPDVPVSLDTSAIVDQEDYFLQAVLPLSRKAELVPMDAQAVCKGLTYCSDSPSQSASQIEERILGAGIAANYVLMNLGQMLEGNNNMIFIAKVFSYIFIVMISLIAVANVFNTISTNIKLRRRELAMLRSVGMSERAFQKMMNFECVFYGLRALLFGVPISLVLSYLIYKGMYISGAEDITFQLPWASVGISVFSVLFVVFITMLYSVSKIKKENIIDALRDDLI